MYKSTKVTSKCDTVHLSNTHFKIQDSITAWTNYNICLFQARQFWCLVSVFNMVGVVGEGQFVLICLAEYVS
jgi:hypothetical protein